MLGIGVIGVGVMGADHARAIARSVAGARLVAVSDPDGARAAAAAGLAAGCAIFDDPLALIDSDAVEAIVIAAPDTVHEALTLACIAAGKPVLCEKPLAASAEGCLRVVEAERATGRKLVQVGFMRRFDPAFVAMKAELDAGRLGRPMLVRCAHRNAEAPPTYGSEMRLTNTAIHEIDVVRWLLGEEIAAVTVFAPKVTGVAARPGDPLLAVLETTGGVLVDIEVFVAAGYGYDVRCEVVCRTGAVSLPSASTDGDFRDRFAGAYRAQLQEWVDGVAVGEVRGADAWDGYVAQAVAEAGVVALRSGRPVEVKIATRPSG